VRVALLHLGEGIFVALGEGIFVALGEEAFDALVEELVVVLDYGWIACLRL